MQGNPGSAIIVRTRHSHWVSLMLETSLFVATIATLGMLSPALIFFW